MPMFQGSGLQSSAHQPCYYACSIFGAVYYCAYHVAIEEDSYDKQQKHGKLMHRKGNLIPCSEKAEFLEDLCDCCAFPRPAAT